MYGPAFSTAVSRVLACLTEKEVEFELINLNLSKAQHKSPDFLKLQPFGQVPVLQDEHLTLFESRAICRYICDKYASQGNKNLMPTSNDNISARAVIDQWLEVESQSFNPPTSTLVAQLVFYPRMKLKQDASMIRDSDRKLKKVLEVYEKRLADGKFLTGNEFSLADLSHLPNMNYLIGSTDRVDVFKSKANVWRWYEEISRRESWKKVVGMF